ncbi:Ribosomal large subunit pseudouridine synthase F [compost metagenome]
MDRRVTDMFLRGMSGGVRILGTMTLPCKVTRVAERVFKIVLTEGKNRQIRRMCEAFGYNVVRLRRMRIMNIHIGDLAIGRWRDLHKDELDELFTMLNYRPSGH